jgi:hypothetical protein
MQSKTDTKNKAKQDRKTKQDCIKKQNKSAPNTKQNWTKKQRKTESTNEAKLNQNA